MNSIHNNPFRIIGVVANASLKDLQSRRSKIVAFARVGKVLHSDYDFTILNPIERTSEIIDKAFSSIEQNQDKINHSLFWFVNANPIDDTAIQHMVNGNVDKAIEIWNKLTEDKEIGAKNFSAFNNLSTLYLLDESDFEQGISIKAELIESEYFIDFVHLVADETVRVDTNKQVEYFVDQIIRELKDEFNTNDLLDYFDRCTGYTQEYVSKRFTDEPIHTIESLIENTKRKRDENEYEAYAYGISLYTESRERLAQLRSLLGSANLKYSILADKLANEILQCSIDYCNANVEDEIDSDFVEKGIKLVKWAKRIAVGNQTVNRINENLEIVESMRDRALNTTIEILESIKSAYRENERKIHKQIQDLKENDIEFKFGFKVINQSAVKENIKNSINWSAVNDLLSELLIDSNLRKIKASAKTEEKNKFWELINWTFEQSTISRPVSNIIEKYRNIQPVLCFEVLSGEITNTNNKPLYVEDIRYIGLKLKVRSSGTQKVTIYKKYIGPDGSLDRNSKSSPPGYSTSNDYTITPNTQVIDLGGYGSDNQCTYKVGEHKIEVYVEHYKIFTKSFRVDWSPDKKAELLRDVQRCEEELAEVKKFKWFRSSETREQEIKDAESKINKARKVLLNR